MSDATYNVEATALFYARPTPKMGDLLLDLNERFAKDAGCHLSVSPLSHDDWWLLACEHFHIMIAFSNEPAGAGKLDGAVRSPINDLNRFDYAQAVQSHTSNLAIEVGDGNAPLPPEARLIMQEFGSVNECDPALKLRALHYAAQFIAEHQGFLALHFGPSDRLFCPVEMKAAACEDLPEALLTHPVPSLPEQGPNGSDGYGLALRNPHHLSGPAVELEGLPVSVPLKTAVSLLATIQRAHKAGKLTLEHGKVLKPSQKLALYVREAVADDATPNGRFILSFWKERGHDAPKPAATVKEAAPEKTTPIRVPEQIASNVAPVTKVAEPSAVEIQPLAPVSGAVQRPAKPEVAHDMVTGTEVHAKPAKGDLLSRLARAFPLESRVKVAGFALILTLPWVWNPYAEFTGGISVQSPTTFAEAAPAAAATDFTVAMVSSSR